MTDFKIDSGIPAPEGTPGRALRYPFASMLPGQSFFMPVLEGEDISKRMRACHNAAKSWALRQRNDAEFKVAEEHTDGNVGFRCWRIT